VRGKVGDASMTLVVEKVKGRLHVYDEYRENGCVVAKCIGPIEEMACLVGIREPRQRSRNWLGAASAVRLRCFWRSTAERL